MRKSWVGVLTIAILSTGCGRPEVYIRTQAPSGTQFGFRSANWEVTPPKKVASNPVYEKAILGLFGSEEAFKERVARDLQSALPQAVVAPSNTYRLELGEIVIRGRLAQQNSIDVPGIPYGNMYTASSQSLLPTPYCRIALEFSVIDAHGKVLMGGVVQEETASDSWSRPDEARLRNALNFVRNRLLEYLSGRMSARHVAPPEG